MYYKQGGVTLRFYTIKLPRFLGGIVKAMLNAIQKEK
ncbi:stage V sporulation protein M [Tumebacillus avium]|uniref:Stage V sporulation protein M n=1 Tax=Tumebacillus avium TaxID=1903704 RepID=A0A1Y0IRC5_9BACL|nr:stage V sporulation protein M [Tumebacillus avium]